MTAPHIPALLPVLVPQARRFRDALDAAGYEAGADFEYHEIESGHFDASGGTFPSRSRCWTVSSTGDG